MMHDPTDDDDFGAPPERAPAQIIPFPSVRPNQKLADRWRAEVDDRNRKAGTAHRFISPMSAIDDVVRLRGMPPLAWPAAWPDMARRCRTYPRDMIGIVGGQGGGKTSFAIQIGLANAANGSPVLWAPLELNAAAIVTRIAANMHGVHAMAVRDHWDADRIRAAMATVDDMWHFVDKYRDPERQILAIRHAVEMAWAIYRMPPTIVVDHIGKLQSPTARDPRSATAWALEELRIISEETDCFMVALSQGSRANQSTLTGQKAVESATDAMGLAAETRAFEEDCANVVALSLFKADDAQELLSHALVGKARHTGQEGRVGFRFHKPGGRWEELDYLPATPTEIAAEAERDKKDKARVAPPRKPKEVAADLNVSKSGDARQARRLLILDAISRHGAMGMELKQMRLIPGAGMMTHIHEALQNLERQGSVEKLPGNRWRMIARKI